MLNLFRRGDGPQKRVGAFMTPLPQTLESTCHVVTARDIMRDKGYRHIPIVDRTKIIGIVSDRDIRTIEFVYRDRDIRSVRLSDVCLFEPYTVTEDTTLDAVLDKMIHDKIGSVIVERQNEVVGIFTMIDACKALRKLS